MPVEPTEERAATRLGVASACVSGGLAFVMMLARAWGHARADAGWVSFGRFLGLFVAVFGLLGALLVSASRQRLKAGGAPTVTLDVAIAVNAAAALLGTWTFKLFLHSP